MKKKVLFAALVLLAGLSNCAMAQYSFSEESSSGHVLHYTINNDGNTVSVSGEDTCSGNVAIPSAVNHGGTTYTVTHIKAYAFQNASLMTSVSIPNTVTTIEDRAFNHCSGLTFITIPNTVVLLGSRAFAGCSGLTEITIPASVESIGSAAFNNCSTLTTVNYNADSCYAFANSEGFFYGCTNFSTLNIGSNVKVIPSLFDGCNSLASVNIPNSVRRICRSAFSSCINLSEVTIGSSVDSIEQEAFASCFSLVSVYYNADSCSYMDGTVFQSCPIENLTFGNNVRYIPDYAFSNLSHLTSIIIPASVTHIGSYAFKWLDNSDMNGVNVYFHMMGSIPPELGEDALSAEYVQNTIGRVQVSITVPCNTLVNYQNNDSWRGLTTTVSDENVDWIVGEQCSDYYVFARPYDTYYGLVTGEDVGHVSGTGSYNTGQTATLQAVAPTGYYFARWNDGNTDNPRQITVTSDTLLVAHFEEGDDPTQGIDGVNGANAKVFAANGQINVEGADGLTVTLYDAAGRQLAMRRNEGAPLLFDVPASGTYLVKVGSAPARRIVVVK